jgi:hypothetical protein
MVDGRAHLSTVWRVFVLLRHRPGVWERTIRAAGPLEAEQAVALADRDVFETLGAQGLDRGLAAGGHTEYRSLKPVGRRSLPIHPTGSPGSAAMRVPVVEVLAPNSFTSVWARVVHRGSQD